MSGDDNFNLDTSDKRRTLWIVLWLNVAIAVGFFVMGYFGDSNALLANGLDNSSDALVYALSLLALSRPRSCRTSNCGISTCAARHRSRTKPSSRSPRGVRSSHTST